MSNIGDNQRFATTEHNEAAEIDKTVIAELNNEQMCNVYRNEWENDQKIRSFGFLVTFFSCNVVIGFKESIRSEGCRRVTVNIMKRLNESNTEPK